MPISQHLCFTGPTCSNERWHVIRLWLCWREVLLSLINFVLQAERSFNFGLHPTMILQLRPRPTPHGLLRNAQIQQIEPFAWYRVETYSMTHDRGWETSEYYLTNAASELLLISMSQVGHTLAAAIGTFVALSVHLVAWSKRIGWSSNPKPCGQRFDTLKDIAPSGQHPCLYLSSASFPFSASSLFSPSYLSPGQSQPFHWPQLGFQGRPATRLNHLTFPDEGKVLDLSQSALL